jgi:hypothetical protein
VNALFTRAVYVLERKCLQVDRDHSSSP